MLGFWTQKADPKKATLAAVVLVVVVGISSLKIPKAFLIRSRAQQNCVHIRADIPHRSAISDFSPTF